MLFKKDWVDAVLSGRKRQTIRLKRPRVRVGRTYAVQTSFRSRGVGRIRVVGVRECRLADLSAADLRREGWSGRSRAEFESYFAEINHFEPQRMTSDDWDALRRRPLWCIDFEPVDEGDAP